MAPPSYFFARRSRHELADPASGRLRRELLAKAGLDEALADVESLDQCAHIDLTGKGPGGESGFLLVALPPSREAPKRLGYYPEFQTWKRAGEGLWIGVDREQPPRPCDLLRETHRRDQAGQPAPRHLGYPLLLADGQEWTVPVVRRPDPVVEAGYDATNLPENIGWDEAGKFVRTIKAQYQAIWEETGELCDYFFGARERGRLEMDVETALRRAIRLLSLNYRYGRHEHGLLHAIDGENVFNILGAAVDWLFVQSILKASQKKSDLSDGGGLNTATGSPAGSPAIDQAGESSP